MIRVYLIFHSRMFLDAVSAVLACHDDIDLVGVNQENATLAADVTAFKPEVILLEESTSEPPPAALHSLLTSPIPCRLITMRMDEDGMHVWSQRWQHTTRPQDLVEAIISARCSE
jgi:chemotaxis response regulator CheB